MTDGPETALGFLIDRVPADTTATLQIPAGADLDVDAISLLLGPRRSAEDGDGAQLPGISTRYQLLQYRCQALGCEIVELRVVLGTDGPPSCPRGHGPLELKA
jgi:hypothetical protein